ncbi:MAG: hypothetical protein KBS76_02290 [Ruminococcus sp.]|nr:hypothetical protein [Candidatus Apopatosoma intestinale]
MKKRILSFALAFLFCFGSIGMLAVAGGHEHIHAATTLSGETATDTTVSFDVPDAGYYIKISTGAIKDNGDADGGKVTFTGLSPNTEYTFSFYQKVSPDDSLIATKNVKTMNKLSSPSTPSLSAVTSTTIAVNSYTTDQYCIKASADDQTIAEGDWKDATGSTYTFTGLTAGTEYKIYARTKGTAVAVSSDPCAALTVTTVGELGSIDLTGAAFSYDSGTDSYTLVLQDTDTTHEYKVGSGAYAAATASGVSLPVSLGNSYTITGRIAAVDGIYGAGKEATQSITIPGVTISTSLTGTTAKLSYTINANSFALSDITVKFQLFEGISELTGCEKQGAIPSIAASQSLTGSLESDIGSASGTICYKATVTGKVNEGAAEVTLYATASSGATLGSASHTHTFDTGTWSKDASGHWHPATCGHTSEKGSFADHNDGNSDGLCDVCGYSMSHTHSLTHYERQEPTATTAGHIEYWYCAGCNTYFSNNSATSPITQAATVLSATGHEHSLAHTIRHEPTATEEGNIEYWYCAGCNTYFSNESATTVITLEQTVLPATSGCAHTLQHYNRQEATPTADGYREHWYCTKCQKYFTNSSATEATSMDALKISAHDHFMVSGVCLICGYTGTHSHSYTSKTESLSYLKSAATCTEAAVYYYSCSTCGAIGTETFTASAGPLGHNFVNGVCTRCSAAEGSIGGISHKNFDPKTTRCSCGALNRNTGYFEISPCSAEAKTTGAACTYTCQTCNKTIAVTWEPSECTGTHHFGTRTQNPNSYVWLQTCDYCGAEKVSEDQSCSHNMNLFGELISTDVDCAVTGEWMYKCRECHSINKVAHAAGNHTWGTGVVTTPATDTAAGVMTYTCVICQKTKTESIAPTAHVHSYGSWIAEVPATCSAEGVKGHYACSCGMNFDESKNVIASLTIAKLSHSFGAVTTVASTCTTAGYEEKTCTACGYVSHVTLPLARHTEKVTNTPATCIADGSDVVTCTVCGQVLETRTVPATGVHSFSSDGDNAKKCVVCGFRYETKVSKGTVYMTFVENGATLTVPSTTADRLTYEVAKKGVADYTSWLKVLSDAKAISGSAELCAAYDVALKNNSAEMPYSADMTVELTVPEEYKKNTVKVFASTANGLIAVESVDRNGDKVSFNANAKYTGEFLVISDSAAKTSNPVVPIVIGIVVVLTIAGVGGYFLYKKGFFTV